MELGIQPNRSPSFGPLIRKCIFNTYLNRVFSPRNPFLFFSFFLLLSFLFQHQSHLHLYYLIDTHNGYSTSTLNGVIYAPIINDIIISVFIQLIIEFFFFFFSSFPQLQILCTLFLAIVVQQCYATKKGGYASPKAPKAVKVKAKTPVKYAGPIVYTAEKPPVIYFPPPPIPPKPKVREQKEEENNNFGSPFCMEPLRRIVV